MEQTEIPNRSMNFLKDFQKYDLGLHGLRMPVFEIDQRHKARLKLVDSTSNYDFLRSLAREGFYKLNLEKGSDLYKRYIDRVNYELQILQELEFIDYIILIWDVINYCRENNIPTGPGRGSCAGSLLLFLIDVTKIDPIKYELFFERFISKARAKKTVIDGVTYFDGSLFPDVDLDICYYNRHKVIAYLEEKFKGKTSKILTLNTLSAKLCIKESGKVVAEKQESEMNDVSSYIPKLFGQVKSLEEAVTESEKFAEWVSTNQEVYKIALKLQNLNKNKGVHPSGLLLAHSLLEESCPVELSSDKQVVSSYDMNNVTAYNIKLDLLGLRGVSVVDDVCKSLGIRYEDIDVNDVFIYQQLQDFKLPHGLFQIEAETNFKVCQKVKPKNLEQLSAVLALGRPSSLSFVESYAKYTNHNQIELPDIESQELKDILSKTGGSILFQETAMQIAHVVFKLSLDEAELIRRACAKKKREEMAQFEKIILDQGTKMNIPKSAEFYWKILVASADYGFNKCLHGETSVVTKNGIKNIKDVEIGDFVKAYDVNNNSNHLVRVNDVVVGLKELFEMEMEDGRKIKCSLDHKFLCSNGEMLPVKEIIRYNHKIVFDEKEEYFLDVPGYEGLYQVSNNGNIKSLSRKFRNRSYGGEIMKGSIDRDGYKKVQLVKDKNRKKYFVHRLVALAFIENKFLYPVINHKNGNKLHNNVDNLEWVTVSQNNIHALRNGLKEYNFKHLLDYVGKGENHNSAKVNEAQIKEIRELRKKGFSLKKLSQEYNLCQSTISKICVGKTWAHVK